MMTEDESKKWRPELPGWSDDILPFYKEIASELPNPCRVVEIGSAHGRSAIFLAQELLALGHGCNTKIFMVDDWGGNWFAECLPSLIKHSMFEELALLRPVRSASHNAAWMFPRGNLDMVFIDGDHSRIGVAKDLASWFEKVSAGGIFAGHDYDEKVHPGVVRAVNDFLPLHSKTLEHPTRSVWRMR